VKLTTPPARPLAIFRDPFCLSVTRGGQSRGLAVCRNARFAIEVPDHFFLASLDFRNRTPSPPPFSSMNSMPARSGQIGFVLSKSAARYPTL
jgi:hypothetical protein